MTALTRRRAAARPDDEGSVAVALVLVVVVLTMMTALFTTAATVSAAVQASNLRARSLNSLASIRSQVIGNLNDGTFNPAAAVNATGCDSPSVLNLTFDGCATVAYAAAASDDAHGTGNLTITVSLTAWQIHGHNTATQLAVNQTSFQAYGSCVTGYVPGTGTGTDNPAVYTPCTAATPGANRHLLWVARDRQGS